MPAKAIKLLVHGEHLSAVVFMSTRGVLDCTIVKQTVSSDMFYDILLCTLLPYLSLLMDQTITALLLL